MLAAEGSYRAQGSGLGGCRGLGCEGVGLTVRVYRPGLGLGLYWASGSGCWDLACPFSCLVPCGSWIRA